MAVTVITPTSLVIGTPSADSKIAGATAINAANTMTIAHPKDGKLLIVLNNTYAGSKAVTISASDVFNSAGQGDLTVTMAQDAVQFVIVDSSRNKKADGNVSLSFASSMTGFVQAFYLP